MSSFGTWHWRLFNVLRRLLGIGAIVNGAVFVAWGLALLARPRSTVAMNGVLATAASANLLVLLVGATALALGAVIVRARSYRPDLGDASWLLEPQTAHAEKREGRTWWTGDQKARSTRAAV
jgi:hypothetical protein